MGDILHCNVRGLRTPDLRRNKVDIIKKILDEKTSIFINLQETHLQDELEIPIEWTHLKSLYDIVFCGANANDPGSGIIVFIRKTEKIMEISTLVEGRLLHIKTENMVSGEIFFFNFMRNQM